MRVSEVYASVQGEGPNTGKTTVFVRFGGCNLRCPGWPCDTQHAIDPAFRKEWTKMSVGELVAEVYKTAELSGAKLITLTGGEPFLQKLEELEDFVCSLTDDHGYQVEAFTNGTLLYPEWAVEDVSMIVDWKLPGSGEFRNDGQRGTNLLLLDASSRWHSVKFVCRDEADFNTAVALYTSLPSRLQTSLIWYYGKVWNGEITDAELAALVMQHKLPWRMNVQLHNYVWPAHERGR